jgi:hypothetical protein
MKKIFLTALVFAAFSFLADCAGKTPLMSASGSGDINAAKDLLDKGAAVDEKGEYDTTALREAADNGHAAVAKLLLDKGADVNAKDAWGETALLGAVVKSHAEVVKLLLERGADVNIKNYNGWTTLAYASKVEIAKLLLDKGADINATNNYGATPLKSAGIATDRDDVARFLVAKGANLEIALANCEKTLAEWSNSDNQYLRARRNEPQHCVELLKSIKAERASMQAADKLEAIQRTKHEEEVEEAGAYKQAKSLNTLQAYAGFLHAHPSSPSRRAALEAMSRIIKIQGGSYESYRKFVAEYEDGMEFVPSQQRLALIGPEGIRVHDIVGLLKQGIKDTVLAAKVRMQNAMYKDFDGKEMVALKKMGMTDVLIEAMLDSTGRAKRAQEELQKKKEMENLLAEIQQAQKKLDSVKAAQEQQQQQPQATASGQKDSGPTLADTVKNCAAQIAALEACKRLPWPANSVCAATAKSQFPCQ